jgi:hypothetical protein
MTFNERDMFERWCLEHFDFNTSARSLSSKLTEKEQLWRVQIMLWAWDAALTYRKQCEKRGLV